MIVSVNGSDVYVSDDGLKHQSGQKALLLIHGSDLNACNDYADAQRKFTGLEMPVTIIAAAEDRMTPARAGKALADSRDGTNFVLIEAAGHNMMVERTDEFNLAVRNAPGV
jgi:pimeloyl-ACP methyl ester carboxylesterase